MSLPTNVVATTVNSLYDVILDLLTGQDTLSATTDTLLTDAIGAADTADTMALSDGASATSKSGPYTYGGASTTYGYSQYS